MVNIGDNIRTARKRKGFTQEELANQIGVTSQAVSRWESGSDSEGNDKQFLQQITDMYRELELKYSDSKEAALEKCKYLEKELERNLGNFVIATCLVERTAELSRYADFEKFECDWDVRKIRQSVPVCR